MYKPTEKIKILLTIKNCKNKKVSLINEKGVLKTKLINSKDKTIRWIFEDFSSKFVRIEVRNIENELVAMTNPIFFTLNNSR